jgi:hypothetical protein
MMSQVNSKYSLEKQLSRYKCKLFLEHNSIQVDEKFLFRLKNRRRGTFVSLAAFWRGRVHTDR